MKLVPQIDNTSNNYNFAQLFTHQLSTILIKIISTITSSDSLRKIRGHGMVTGVINRSILTPPFGPIELKCFLDFCDVRTYRHTSIRYIDHHRHQDIMKEVLYKRQSPLPKQIFFTMGLTNRLTHRGRC